MLIVHGAAGGFDQGIDLTGAMAGRGYQLISPSRFGYLRSTMPGNHIVGIFCRRLVVYPVRHPSSGTLSRAGAAGPRRLLAGGTSIQGGAVSRAIFDSDFVAWAALKLMPIMPGGMTRMMLGTDSAVMRADIKTAGTPEPYLIEKITCPVLTISAQDDRLGTAVRAKQIAATVRDGRAIIFPIGGHALVGYYADALREITSFLQAVQERSPPK